MSRSISLFTEYIIDHYFDHMRPTGIRGFQSGKTKKQHVRPHSTVETRDHSIDSLYSTNSVNVCEPSDNQQFRYKIARGW